jgi:hypothetical protein
MAELKKCSTPQARPRTTDFPTDFILASPVPRVRRARFRAGTDTVASPANHHAFLGHPIPSGS